MVRRLVGSLTVVMVVATTALVATATPAPAAAFASGRVHCTLSGKTTYFPRLLPSRLRSTKARLIADLACDVGETGIPGVTVVSGRLHGVSQQFMGDCTNDTPGLMTAQIHWKTSTGTILHDTNVTWTPLNASTNPYSYQFANQAPSGSYGLQWSYAKFSADASLGSPVNDAGCGPKLGVHRWDFVPTTAELSIGFPPPVADATPGFARAGTTNLDVTIDGSNFEPGTTVAFSGSGITVNSTTFVSSSQLLANVDIDPLAPTGARTITVETPRLATGTCTGCFIVSPAVTAFSPSSAGQGVSNVMVTLNGAGFDPGTAVAFANSGITVNYTIWNSTTQMSANISVAANAPVGPTDVTITNPDNTGGTCQGCFTVNPAPVVTSSNPSLGIGAVARVVHVMGLNFQNGATVAISGLGLGVNSQSFVASGQIDVNMTIQSYAAAGNYDIVVTNPDGGTSTCSGCFTVNPAPTVSAISPDNLVQGQKNMNLTLTGSDFASGASTSFSSSGITVNSTTFVSSTQLTVNVSLAGNAPLLLSDVTVTNPDGGFGTCVKCFLVTKGPATVTSLSPSSAGQGASNVSVTISGAGFAPGAAVAFANSGITVNYTNWISTGQITANISIAGNAAVGPTDVSVTNPGSTAGTCVGCFTVHVAPVATSAGPALGVGAVSRVVKIMGSNFQSGTTVAIPGLGITLNSQTFVNSGEIDVNMTVQSYATAGNYDIVVTNPDGGTSTCSGCYTVNPAPNPTGINPGHLPEDTKNFNVTVTGSLFVNGAKVSFGSSGITVNSTTFVSSTQLTANVTVAANAPLVVVDVIVTNPDGGVGACGLCFLVTKT